jgi:hypothetical protein
VSIEFLYEIDAAIQGRSVVIREAEKVSRAPACNSKNAPRTKMLSMLGFWLFFWAELLKLFVRWLFSQLLKIRGFFDRLSDEEAVKLLKATMRWVIRLGSIIMIHRLHRNGLVDWEEVLIDWITDWIFDLVFE